ncbi:MAG: glycosyltransferase [Spirochaetales bacterium]|nr:glycosyltransferase [Spirochaetales bacterium]
MNKQKKIVFLAPEIPALSATFVYNEIIELNKKGYAILPVSVHYPHSLANDVYQEPALENILYLYNEPKIKIIISAFLLFFCSPLKYIKTGLISIFDTFKVGPFNRIGLGLQFRFLIAAHAAWIFKKNKVDHIHTHFSHVPTDIAMYASLLTGIPFTFTSHANDLFERGWLIKEKVNRAYKAVTISNYNADFIKSLGVKENKISIVRCGVDALSTQENKITQDVNIFKIGTLGRLVEKKGVTVLIDAFSLLYKSNSNIKLEIAGDGPLKVELEEQVKALGLSHVITFPGALSHDKVSNWLNTLDLFTLACVKDSNGDQDGIPVVLMEAMVENVPVISTSLSGIPELIVDEETGLLAEPGNSQDLAAKIQTLMENKDLRDSMIVKGYKHIKKEFDKSVNIDRLIKVFEGNTYE